MKKLIIITLLVAYTTQAQEFKKLWEVSGLESPESIVYNESTHSYYISNVAGQPAEKNGLGYISVADESGNITTQKWVKGLHAPKGMAIIKNKLYIADIDRVIVVDIMTGKIIKTYNAKGATFLNDVEADKKTESVYITDTFGGNAIYKIQNENINLWIKDERLNYPNGIKVIDDHIFVATWGVVTDPKTFGTEIPGKLLSINLQDTSIQEVTKPIGNLDGLVAINDYFLTSDWIAGALITVQKNGESRHVLDLNPGSADILYVRKKNIVLVPQMQDGTLNAYKVIH